MTRSAPWLWREPAGRAALSIVALIGVVVVLVIVGALVAPPLLAVLALVAAVMGMSLALVMPWLVLGAVGFAFYKWRMGGLKWRMGGLAAWISGQTDGRAAAYIPMRSIGGRNLVRSGFPALPPEIEVHARRIRQRAEGLKGAPQLLSTDDQYLVQEVLGEYLPQVLGTYESLPEVVLGAGVSDLAGNEPEGASAPQLLRAQLDLLDRSLDGVSRRAWQSAADSMRANQHFLEQRLGQGSASDLRVR